MRWQLGVLCRTRGSACACVKHDEELRGSPAGCSWLSCFSVTDSLLRYDVMTSLSEVGKGTAWLKSPKINRAPISRLMTCSSKASLHTCPLYIYLDIHQQSRQTVPLRHKQNSHQDGTRKGQGRAKGSRCERGRQAALVPQYTNAHVSSM
jgi:hypothetical protein